MSTNMYAAVLWSEATQNHATFYGARMHMRNVHGLKFSHGKWRKATRDQDRTKRR